MSRKDAPGRPKEAADQGAGERGEHLSWLADAAARLSDAQLGELVPLAKAVAFLSPAAIKRLADFAGAYLASTPGEDPGPLGFLVPEGGEVGTWLAKLLIGASGGASRSGPGAEGQNWDASLAPSVEDIVRWRQAGHELGGEPSILNRQGRALVDAWNRALRLDEAAEAAALAVIEDPEAVLGGAPVVVDATRACGYVGEIRAEELGGTFDWLAQRAFEWAMPEDPSGKAALVDRIREDIFAALAARGLVRGPCVECRRPAWVPLEPIRTGRGRFPLSFKLCPACEAAHIQRKEATKKRRLRTPQE